MKLSCAESAEASKPAQTEKAFPLLSVAYLYLYNITAAVELQTHNSKETQDEMKAKDSRNHNVCPPLPTKRKGEVSCHMGFEAKTAQTTRISFPLKVAEGALCLAQHVQHTLVGRSTTLQPCVIAKEVIANRASQLL